MSPEEAVRRLSIEAMISVLAWYDLQVEGGRAAVFCERCSVSFLTPDHPGDVQNNELAEYVLAAIQHELTAHIRDENSYLNGLF